jgi:hypothetical protein
MWEKSYSKTFKGVTIEQIWEVLTDFDNWPAWQSDLVYCKLLGNREVGSSFELKPKKGPKVRIQILEYKRPRYFVDLTKFPGAKMYGIHHFEKTKEGVRLTTTMRITGILGLLWRKLVAEDIVDHEPDQMEALVERAKNTRK